MATVGAASPVFDGAIREEDQLGKGCRGCVLLFYFNSSDVLGLDLTVGGVDY